MAIFDGGHRCNVEQKMVMLKKITSAGFPEGCPPFNTQEEAEARGLS